MPKRAELSKGKYFYDLDGPVGYAGKCQNLTGDVTLVQYLLAGYYAKCSGGKPLGRLAVDGSFGPMTHYWSIFFQLQVKQGDTDFVEMGNFLPSGASIFGGAAAFYKMIVQLNTKFREVNSALPEDLEKDPGFPVMLRGRIK